VDEPTLNRFYSLHYLLPFMIFGVVVLHIWALHVPGNNNPLGIDPKSGKDTVPFHPYYTAKDTFALVAFLILFAWFVFYAPGALSHPDNNIPADPLVTPPHIVPEWYFLPFYAILRSIPHKLAGVIAMFGAVLILFAVPWLDWARVRSMRFRPLLRLFFVLFIAACLVLGYVGAQLPEEPWITVGRIATAYYFGYFLVILPLFSLNEKPRVLPESIHLAVLGKRPQAGPVPVAVGADVAERGA
jgi:ubiquinol-cytochrome c reductase cytochrome b subunit